MIKVFFTAVILASCFVVSQQINDVDATATQPADPKQVLVLNEKPVQTTTKSTSTAPASWNFFQLVFCFGKIPSETEYTDVYGLKIGAPGCDGKGTDTEVETSVFASATDTVNGVSSSVLVATSKNVTGLQGSVVNYSEKINGLQFGVVNMAKS